jgi:hypothetical protein
MEDNTTPENEVLKWLRRIGLEDLYDAFKNEGFDDLETVAFTFRADTPETRELLHKLNITKLGHQQRVIHKAQQILGSQSPTLNGEPRSRANSSVIDSDIVELNVGGRYFATSRQTLQSQDSMLFAMFSGKYNLKKDNTGRFFIDRDGKYFNHILNYLRDGTTPPFSPKYKPEKYHCLASEAQFYQIQGLIDKLQQKYPKWKLTEASSTIVLSPDGYTAESRSDSGDYYIARCTEQCFMLTPQTKEYFEAQVFIPENSIVAIGLGSDKMDPAKIQNSGWSKENCGVGLYIFGGAIYRRGKVVEKLTLSKEDSHFGWLIQGYKIQFYCMNKAIGKPVSLDDEAYKAAMMYPIVVLAKGARATITNDTLE